MSVRDFARVLGVHPQTVYERDKRGDLAALGVRVLNLGRAKRIVTADVRRLLGPDDQAEGMLLDAPGASGLSDHEARATIGSARRRTLGAA